MPRRKTPLGSPLKRPLDDEYSYESPGKKTKPAAVSEEDAESRVSSETKMVASSRQKAKLLQKGNDGASEGSVDYGHHDNKSTALGLKTQEVVVNSSSGKDPKSSVRCEKRNLSLEALCQVGLSELQNITRQAPTSSTSVMPPNATDSNLVIAESATNSPDGSSVSSMLGGSQAETSGQREGTDSINIVYADDITTTDKAEGTNAENSEGVGSTLTNNASPAVLQRVSEYLSNRGRKRKYPAKPGRHICPFCGRGCAKPSVLQKHLRTHTGERPYPCLSCGFSFKTKSNLYKHCKSRSHALKAVLKNPTVDSGTDAPLKIEEEDDDGNESDDLTDQSDYEEESNYEKSTILSEDSFHKREHAPVHVLQKVAKYLKKPKDKRPRIEVPQKKGDARPRIETKMKILNLDFKEGLKSKLERSSSVIELQRQPPVLERKFSLTDERKLHMVQSQFLKIAPKQDQGAVTLSSAFSNLSSSQPFSTISSTSFPVLPEPKSETIMLHKFPFGGSIGVRPLQLPSSSRSLNIPSVLDGTEDILEEKRAKMKSTKKNSGPKPENSAVEHQEDVDMVKLPQPNADPQAATKALKDLEYLSEKCKNALDCGVHLVPALMTHPDGQISVQALQLPKTGLQGDNPPTLSPSVSKKVKVVPAESKVVDTEMLKERIQNLISNNDAIVRTPMTDPPRYKRMSRQNSETGSVNGGRDEDLSGGSMFIPKASTATHLQILKSGALQSVGDLTKDGDAQSTPQWKSSYQVLNDWANTKPAEVSKGKDFQKMSSVSELLTKVSAYEAKDRQSLDQKIATQLQDIKEKLQNKESGVIVKNSASFNSEIARQLASPSMARSLSVPVSSYSLKAEGGQAITGTQSVTVGSQGSITKFVGARLNLAQAKSEDRLLSSVSKEPKGQEITIKIQLPKQGDDVQEQSNTIKDPLKKKIREVIQSRDSPGMKQSINFPKAFQARWDGHGDYSCTNCNVSFHKEQTLELHKLYYCPAAQKKEKTTESGRKEKSIDRDKVIQLFSRLPQDLNSASKVVEQTEVVQQQQEKLVTSPVQGSGPVTAAEKIVKMRQIGSPVGQFNIQIFPEDSSIKPQAVDLGSPLRLRTVQSQECPDPVSDQILMSERSIFPNKKGRPKGSKNKLRQFVLDTKLESDGQKGVLVQGLSPLNTDLPLVKPQVNILPNLFASVARKSSDEFLEKTIAKSLSADLESKKQSQTEEARSLWKEKLKGKLLLKRLMSNKAIETHSGLSGSIEMENAQDEDLQPSSQSSTGSGPTTEKRMRLSELGEIKRNAFIRADSEPAIQTMSMMDEDEKDDVDVTLCRLASVCVPVVIAQPMFHLSQLNSHLMYQDKSCNIKMANAMVTQMGKLHNGEQGDTKCNVSKLKAVLLGLDQTKETLEQSVSEKKDEGDNTSEEDDKKGNKMKEIPSPTRSLPLCLYGHNYPSLRISTHTSFCSVSRPQPMYVPQGSNKKVSMYSNWRVSSHNPNPIGLTSDQLLKLYNSKHSGDPAYVKANELGTKSSILTHSSYWTFKENKKDERKTVDKERMKVEVAKTSKRDLKTITGGHKSLEEYTYVRGRGRGNYVCNQCGIRCKKPSMLKKHIRTHTDLRPYHCIHCKFSFKTKGNLTKHMKSKAHHKKCVELAIVPVPTQVNEAQIDRDALAAQCELSKMAKIILEDGGSLQIDLDTLEDNDDSDSGGEEEEDGEEGDMMRDECFEAQQVLVLQEGLGERVIVQDEIADEKCPTADSTVIDPDMGSGLLGNAPVLSATIQPQSDHKLPKQNLMTSLTSTSDATVFIEVPDAQVSLPTMICLMEGSQPKTASLGTVYGFTNTGAMKKGSGLPDSEVAKSLLALSSQTADDTSSADSAITDIKDSRLGNLIGELKLRTKSPLVSAGETTVGNTDSSPRRGGATDGEDAAMNFDLRESEINSVDGNPVTIEVKDTNVPGVVCLVYTTPKSQNKNQSMECDNTSVKEGDDSNDRDVFTKEPEKQGQTECREITAANTVSSPKREGATDGEDAAMNFDLRESEINSVDGAPVTIEVKDTNVPGVVCLVYATPKSQNKNQSMECDNTSVKEGDDSNDRDVLTKEPEKLGQTETGQRSTSATEGRDTEETVKDSTKSSVKSEEKPLLPTESDTGEFSTRGDNNSDTIPRQPSNGVSELKEESNRTNDNADDNDGKNWEEKSLNESNGDISSSSKTAELSSTTVVGTDVEKNRDETNHEREEAEMVQNQANAADSSTENDDSREVVEVPVSTKATPMVSGQTISSSEHMTGTGQSVSKQNYLPVIEFTVPLGGFMPPMMPSDPHKQGNKVKKPSNFGPIVGQLVRQLPITLQLSSPVKTPTSQTTPSYLPFLFRHPFSDVVDDAEVEVISEEVVEGSGRNTVEILGGAMIDVDQSHRKDEEIVIDSSVDEKKEENVIVENEIQFVQRCLPRNNVNFETVRVTESSQSAAMETDSVSCKGQEDVLKRKEIVLNSGTNSGEEILIVIDPAYSKQKGISQDKKFTCDRCDKSFPEQQQLVLHNYIHCMESPYKCNVCGATFTNIRYFNMHKAQHSSDESCPEVTVKSPRPFRCEDCDVGFRTKAHLNRHFKSKWHINIWEVMGKLPPGTFSKVEKMLYILDSNDEQGFLKTLQDLSKSDNGQLVKVDHSLVKGLVVHVLPTSTEMELSSSDSKVDLEEHLEKNPEEEFFEAHTKAEYEKHNQASNEKVTVEIKHEPIEYGDISSSLARSEEEGEGAQRPVTPKENESHLCGICRRGFLSLSHLKNHMVTHAELRPYVCEYCDAGFTKAQSLRIHLQTHAQERPYVCGTCGDTFAASDDIKSHIKQQHTASSKSSVPVETKYKDSFSDPDPSLPGKLTAIKSSPDHMVVSDIDVLASSYATGDSESVAVRSNSGGHMTYLSNPNLDVTSSSSAVDSKGDAPASQRTEEVILKHSPHTDLSSLQCEEQQLDNADLSK